MFVSTTRPGTQRVMETTRSERAKPVGQAKTKTNLDGLW